VTRRPSRAKTAAGAGARNVRPARPLPAPQPEITAGHTVAPHVSDVIAPVHADYRGTESAPGTRRILPAPTDGATEED
jgi:hypothetical protein